VPRTHWRLLHTGGLSAARNMAVDEALFNSISRGAPPVLRTYAWEPPGVSLGYAQPIDRGVNRDAIRARGYGLVRRPTGGRAIIHHHELTYSVALRTDDLSAGDSVLKSYREISRGIEAGLELLGIPARLPRKKRQAIKHKDLPSVCFAASLGGDMEVDGRKIVGSAQMRRSGVILQHGSIPFRLDEPEHVAILAGGAGAGESLSRAAVGIEDALGRKVCADEVANALVQGFIDAFGIGFEPVELTPEELADADALEREKYATNEWTLNRGRAG